MYNSDYLPEKSIYQSDARIFHRGGYVYDTVAGVTACRLEAGCLLADLALESGGVAYLALEPVAPGIVRLQFWEDEAEFDVGSVMIQPQDDAPLSELRSAYGVHELLVGDYAIRLISDPFTIQVLDHGGRLLFTTEAERVAGDYVTPPLGFRRSPSGPEPYLSWRIHNRDRFFGLGEKWNKVEKTSTRATVWSADTCGTNTTDMSYKSVPVLFSTAGWGVMLHTSWRSFWEIGTFSYTAGSCLSESLHLDAFLFIAPTLAGLLEKYTALTGRPQMPPAWALGIWMSRCQYENRVQVQDVLDRLRGEDIPCDVIHLDPQWMQATYFDRLGVDACDFVWNEAAWPDHAQMLQQWRDDGISACLWVNPYLPEGTPIYEEARAGGYLLRSEFGRPARLEHGQPVGLVDFTNPDAAEWWKGKLKDLAAEGAAVFKPDYGDRVPEDALFFNGRSGREMHNLYLYLYTRAAFEAAQEVHSTAMVWRRAGYVGSQRFPGTWAGDTQVSWEAMRCCLRGGLSAGLTGEAFWSHDVGGFVGAAPDPELYIRWAQFGLFSPLTRFHGTTPREPWEFGEAALAITRHYAHLRYRLMPYLLATAQEATVAGLPVLRHMALAFPAEPNVETLDEQYMLGGDLLVVPVLEPGARTVTVYLPRGRWWPLEGGAPVEGGRFITAAAPLDRIPLFVREGAVIPRLTEAPPHLKDLALDGLRVDVYPGDARRGLYIPFGARAARIQRGPHSLTISPLPGPATVRLVGCYPAWLRGATITHRDGDDTWLAVDTNEGASIAFA